MALITAYVFHERLVLGEQGNDRILLATILVPTCGVLAFIPFTSKILLHNQASRRAFINIFATLSLVLANRVTGVLYEEMHSSIMTMDIALMLFYWTHMIVNTRKAIPFFMLHLFAFFLCIWDPQLVFWLMTLGALFTACGTVWLWVTDDL